MLVLYLISAEFGFAVVISVELLSLLEESQKFRGGNPVSQSDSAGISSHRSRRKINANKFIRSWDSLGRVARLWKKDDSETYTECIWVGGHSWENKGLGHNHTLSEIRARNLNAKCVSHGK